MRRDRPADDVAPDWTRTYLLPALGILIAIGGALRVWHGDSGIAAHLDDTTLLYLGVAAALILARDLKTFAWGDFKVELEPPPPRRDRHQERRLRHPLSRGAAGALDRSAVLPASR